MNNDDILLDWLEEHQGYGLISDDNGHWACVTNGMQNVPDGDEPQEIWTTFIVEADEWFDSIREAINNARTKGE